MNTPKTDNIKSSLSLLPDMGDAESIVSRLRKAEEAMNQAKAEFDRQLEVIAETITEEGDGWTFMEIWETPLRGETVLINKVREITNEL